MSEGILGLDLPAAESTAQHVLIIPRGCSPEALFDLINQLYPAVSPVPQLDGPPIALSTRTDIHGPALTPDGGTAWRFITPRQRDEAPDPDTVDPDGLYFAFEEGLPEDEELRVVLLLLSLARRFEGQINFDSQEPEGGVLIEPDPHIRIDLTIWSWHRLGDLDLLDVVRTVEPDAVLPPPDNSFTGEPPEAAELPLNEHAQVHGEAFALDAAMMQHPPEEDVAYSTIVIPLIDTETPDLPSHEGALDSLVIHVGPADDSMPAPRGIQEPLGWHCYEIRWLPDEDSQLFTDVPEPGFVESREFARFRVRELALTLALAVDGLVVDADGFLVDRHSLHPDA